MLVRKVNRIFTCWDPSLSHISINVHYQVTQLRSKARQTPYILELLQMVETFLGGGDCLRGLQRHIDNMIIYSLHNTSDNYPGHDMDTA